MNYFLFLDESGDHGLSKIDLDFSIKVKSQFLKLKLAFYRPGTPQSEFVNQIAW
jgi:hypothetical protein